MKKLILSTALMVGMTVASYGQGTVNLSNNGNNDASSTATSNGQYWIDVDGNGAGAAVVMDFLANAAWSHVSINLYAGSTSSSLNLIASIVGTDDATYGYYAQANGFGNFADLNLADINTGLTADAVIWLKQEVWFGDAYTTYADAVLASQSGLAYTAENVWQNPSGGAGVPPFQTPAAALTGMPATVLTFVPEPGSISMLGLGALMMLIRRRK